MKKKIFIVLFFFFLTNCGYTQIYNNNYSQDINIEIINFEGDEYFNKKLIIEIEKNNSETKADVFKVDIKTIFEKVIISKDKQGKTTNLDLIVNTIFNVRKDNLEKTFSYRENLKIEKKSDSFEQQKYENIIKANFAKTIRNKLILELNSLKNQND